MCIQHEVGLDLMYQGHERQRPNAFNPYFVFVHQPVRKGNFLQHLDELHYHLLLGQGVSTILNCDTCTFVLGYDGQQ